MTKMEMKTKRKRTKAAKRTLGTRMMKNDNFDMKDRWHAVIFECHTIAILCMFSVYNGQTSFSRAHYPLVSWPKL